MNVCVGCTNTVFSPSSSAIGCPMNNLRSSKIIGDYFIDLNLPLRFLQVDFELCLRKQDINLYNDNLIFLIRDMRRT